MKSHDRIANTDNRFMNELFRIVSGALRLDIEKVRNYTNFLADKLEQEGDTASAARLRTLLAENDHQLKPTSVAFARALPVDSETRFPLIERVNLQAMRELPMVLEDEQWGIVHEFLGIAKCHSLLESEGVTSSVNLLVYGPPGCGKSRLARHISIELGLDLYVARLDGLISSYLGSTSKNIRALFEFAARNPCVLFLDEFDAIAKLRGDTQELGELKRVVNSFIQNLDGLGAQSIIVAATNHEGLLDSAIWRRFAYRLNLGYPSAHARAKMWEGFLPQKNFGPRAIEILVDLSEGFSGSDIQETCLRLRRQRITTRKDARLTDALRALENLSTGEGEDRRFLAGLREHNPQAVADFLRHRNPKLYSSSALADLLGISKATASRWARKG